MYYMQENRNLRIDTPLGKDVLLVAGMIGEETISSPFSFKLALISENHNIDPEGIVGKKAAVSIDLPSGAKRYVNGILTQFSQGEGRREDDRGRIFSSYGATLTPALWLLTMTGDCRIFQDLSVPEIVEQVLKEHNIQHEMRLASSYPKWEYCVQYMETDLAFVSRLLEGEGIYYFFEHTQKDHKVILADMFDCHKPCPNQEIARYELSAGGVVDDDTITALGWGKEVRPGKYAVKDYNFTIPTVDLGSSVPTLDNVGPGDREIYWNSSGHANQREGDRVARLRMEEEDARITTLTGTSGCRAFTSGYRFTLKDYHRKEMDGKDYVLTRVSHSATQSWGNNSQFHYRNTFCCIPYEVQFRARRSTPRPVIQGTQTAVVTGPKGEEIYTDRYGRVKVQFHWDRYGKRDEKSSCWIRVGQLWAGSGWGSVCIPRIGQEVIVDFLEGDPDRPIIIGCVYNSINPPPYEMPGEKTKIGIKSNSTIGGGGSNEISLNDKKGSEEVYIHGEKDWTIVVNNDKSQFVGNDETHKVKGSMILDVDKKITIKCGSSTIVMTPDAIEIDSPTVKINCGGGAQGVESPQLTPAGGGGGGGGGGVGAGSASKGSSMDGAVAAAPASEATAGRKDNGWKIGPAKDVVNEKSQAASSSAAGVGAGERSRVETAGLAAGSGSSEGYALKSAASGVAGAAASSAFSSLAGGAVSAGTGSGATPTAGSVLQSAAVGSAGAGASSVLTSMAGKETASVASSAVGLATNAGFANASDAKTGQTESQCATSNAADTGSKPSVCSASIEVTGEAGLATSTAKGDTGKDAGGWVTKHAVDTDYKPQE